MLSVYSRHYPPCPSDDINYKRCRCPKWINGIIGSDGPLAKKKKQERLIGSLHYCLRLGWIKSNPAVLLGRIRADGPPTDYFPKNEFDKIMDAT